MDRPLRPERLLLEEKGEALREGGRPCVAMPLNMACSMANTLALEFSRRTFTCNEGIQDYRLHESFSQEHSCDTVKDPNSVFATPICLICL